jgi:hypothetical protein
MIRAIRKVGIRQLLALAEYDLPPRFYEKSVLMLGDPYLNKMATYFGVTERNQGGKVLFWFNSFYKPGRHSHVSWIGKPKSKDGGKST